MQLDKDNAALIVIDMQNSFCKADGKVADIGLDTTACQAVISPCSDVLSIARGAAIPIIFTRYVYAPDYADGGVMIEHLMPQLKDVEALQTGSSDADIVPELTPASGEHIIDKNRPSAFYGTRLDELLATLDRRQLLVCGVTTNCCVESTVRDASHRDMQVFVVGDACAELDAQRHAVSLQTMDMLFADVIAVEGCRTALS